MEVSWQKREAEIRRVNTGRKASNFEIPALKS